MVKSRRDGKRSLSRNSSSSSELNHHAQAPQRRRLALRVDTSSAGPETLSRAEMRSLAVTHVLHDSQTTREYVPSVSSQEDQRDLHAASRAESQAAFDSQATREYVQSASAPEHLDSEATQDVSTATEPRGADLPLRNRSQRATSSGKGKTKQCNHCFRTDHARKSHNLCPFNPINAPAPNEDNAFYSNDNNPRRLDGSRGTIHGGIRGGRGRDPGCILGGGPGQAQGYGGRGGRGSGRGRGGGRGRVRSVSSQRSMGNNTVHWTRISDPDSYSLMFADEAKDSLFLNPLRNYCYDIVGNMLDELEKEFPDLDNAENVEPFHVFCILASEFISELAVFTDRRLHLARKGSLGKTEVFQVIGAFLYCQLVGFNLKVSMEMFDAYLKRTSSGWSGPELDRVKLLLKHFSAFHPGLIESQLTRQTPNSPRTKRTTSPNLGKTADVVKDMRNFEEKLFVKTRQIATSKHQHVVVDDELFGTRSSGVQRREQSDRKAGKDGPKSDTVADALLRIMLATQHCGEENYTQPQAVNALLKECDTLDKTPGLMRGRGVTADRGYCKATMWSSVLSKGAWFLMASNSAADPFLSLGDQLRKFQRRERTRKIDDPRRDTVENAAQRAANVNLTFDSDFLIDDNPSMGREIFTARGKLRTDDDVEEEVQAIAFRDYQGRASEDTTRVIRFVQGGGAPFSDRLANTMCMEKLRVPRSTLRGSQVLFFPVATKSSSLADMERRLKQTILPLTCWQRCADWFVLRLFTITATTSGAITSKDENVIRYLRKEDSEDPDSSLPAGFTDADSTTDNAGTTRVDDVDDDFDDDVDDGGARAAAMADEDDESDLDTTCSGPGSQADTAFEDPDNEAYSAVANADADAGEMERAKCELMKSWFFTRGAVTKAMKSGTINAKNLFKALQRQSWCIELYDVGLLANAKHPYIAASCDGIGLIRPPCEANSISPVSVLAAIEFETRSGVDTLDRARKVSTEHGTYFQCTVQDEVWWDAVPKANRAQVLHQAVVLDTDYVLFVEGSTMELIYSCLVCVPAAVRSSYLAALLRHKRLLEWAYKTPNDGTSLPKPPLELFSAVDCTIIASHMRLWRAVRTKVLADGKPLPPIRIFKCLAQCAYNYMKGGTDRHTQFVAAITNMGSFKLNFEHKICLHGILQLVANSFTLYRVFRACTTPDFKFKFPYNSILEFRTACNMVSDLRTFCLKLSCSLAEPGFSSASPRSCSQSDQISPTSSHSKDDHSTQAQADKIVSSCKWKHVGKIREFFNKGDGQQVRLDKSLNHNSISLGKRPSGQLIQRMCAMCGDNDKRASRMCTTCKVPLHIHVTASNGPHSCHDQWHSNEFCISHRK